VLRHLPELAVDTFPQAFAAGQKLLDAGTGPPSRAEYHRAILGALGVHRPAPKLLVELDQPASGGTAIIRTADPPTGVPWISTLEDLVPMTGPNQRGNAR
jgi:hypothetical protein